MHCMCIFLNFSSKHQFRKAMERCRKGRNLFSLYTLNKLTEVFENKARERELTKRKIDKKFALYLYC